VQLHLERFTYNKGWTFTLADLQHVLLVSPIDVQSDSDLLSLINAANISQKNSDRIEASHNITYQWPLQNRMYKNKNTAVALTYSTTIDSTPAVAWRAIPLLKP